MKVKIGIGGLVVLILVAIIGPHVAPYDPSTSSSAVLQGPSGAHLFGTTLLGQDVFSQFLVGAGPTLLVGFEAAGIATAISILIGVPSGYFGGPVGEGLTLVSNVFLVLPTLPLLIVVVGYLPGSSYAVLGLVIGLTSWAFGARVIRAQTLSLKSRDWVEAARATGDAWPRILFNDLLPGLIPVISASFLFSVAFSILTETGLEFLGLGNLSQWTWGTMLYWTQNDAAYQIGAWWWYVPPGLAIALIGLCLALVNFGIDERGNARLQRAWGERGLTRRFARRRPAALGGESPQ
jgi:peptide/nickel transport system permease protein